MNDSRPPIHTDTDHAAAEAIFRSRLHSAYRLAEPGEDSPPHGRRSLVVNVIDPGSLLSRCGLAALRQGTLRSPKPDLAFAAIELDRCAGLDTLAQDVVAQILFAFDAIEKPSQEEGRIQRQFAELRRNLVPWSASSLHELSLWARANLKNRPLVLAVRGADDFPHEWGTRAVRLVHGIADSLCARLIFVISERRPYDCDLRILNPLPDRKRFSAEIATLLTVSQERPASPPARDSDAGSSNTYGFWQRFADWIWPRRESKDAQQEVAGLICAATYPSYRLRERALKEIEAYADSVADTRDNEGPAPAQAVSDAARAALFLKLLEVAFPDVMHATQSQPDGYHQLHRLQLTLVPQRHRSESTQKLTSREWREFADDPRLHAFFTYAMSDVGRSAPRVRPFVSATAIKRHLLGLLVGPRRSESDPAYAAGLALQEFCNEVAAKVLDTRISLEDRVRSANESRRAAIARLVDVASSGAEEDIPAAVATLRRTSDLWVAAQKQLDDNRMYDPEMALRHVLDGIRSTMFPTERDSENSLEPGDAIELALRRLVFLEIDAKPVAESIRKCIDDLRTARDLTDGALGIDAEIGIARALSMLGKADEAAAALGTAAAWAGDDPLGCAAVDLGKAFWRERQGDLKKAEDACLKVLNRADELGAHELVARAAYGVMRCRIARVNRPGWQSFFRARAFLSIQTARSPFLSEVVNASQPRLFISYRRSQEELVRDLRDKLRVLATEVNVWVDFDAINEQHTEFRPAMQLGLDLSEAVLLVFSPEYFESPWCSYELTTTLARQRLSGQSVFWICVDPRASEPSAPRDHVRALAQRAATSESERAFFDVQLGVVLAMEPAYGSVLAGPPTAPAIENIAGYVRDKLKSRVGPPGDGPPRSGLRGRTPAVGTAGAAR